VSVHSDHSQFVWIEFEDAVLRGRFTVLQRFREHVVVGAVDLSDETELRTSEHFVLQNLYPGTDFER
jgi:hypothetical protein